MNKAQLLRGFLVIFHICFGILCARISSANFALKPRSHVRILNLSNLGNLVCHPQTRQLIVAHSTHIFYS